MIRENQKLFNLALVLIDALVISVSLAVSWWLRFKTTLFGPIGEHLPLQDYAFLLIFAVIPVYLILYFSFGLYKPRRTIKRFFLKLLKLLKLIL